MWKIVWKKHEVRALIVEKPVLQKPEREQRSLTQELLLSEMVRLGYRGGSVRIGHCRNAAFALELCTELRRRFPGAEVKSYPLRGLCSYYAEHGGIMLGFAS